MSDFITPTRLRQIAGVSTQTMFLDRRSGLLAKGERKPGVRGLCVSRAEARNYLRARGLSHLIREHQLLG